MFWININHEVVSTLTEISAKVFLLCFVDKWLMVAVVQDSTIEKLTNYSYTITKLSPGTAYYFSIVCQNEAGVSDS